MPEHTALGQCTHRIVLWSFVIGLAFAIPSGIAIHGSSSAGPSGSQMTMHTSYNLPSAIFGFLIGGGVGALIGSVRHLPRCGKAIAAILLTAVGGMLGSVVAALVGAQTTIVVTANSVSGEHGASAAVIAAGALVGMTVTLLMLWSIRRSIRHCGPKPTEAGQC